MIHPEARSSAGACQRSFEPVAVARNSGYGGRELRRIGSLVVAHQQQLREAWHEFFDT
ncbi:MAG: DUF4160 domain-containing protein [Gemmatimonadota bacterium]